jgi:hypothetical protein
LRNLIIVSRCLGIEKIQENNYLLHFHFQGALAGFTIKNLKLESKTDFEIGEDYIMYVEMQYLRKKTLWGKILKAKKINEMNTQAS